MAKRSREQVKEYARGYTAGRKNHWPDHRPPAPPCPIVAAMFKAAFDLRDQVISQIGGFDENDPMALHLYKYTDALEATKDEVVGWLRDGDNHGEA